MVENRTRRSLREEQALIAEAVAPNEPVQRKRRLRIWVWSLSGVLFLALVATTGLVAHRIYTDAQVARTSLLGAVEDARAIKNAVLGRDAQAALEASDALSQKMDTAREHTSGRLWALAESVPLPLANNLVAVRTISEVGSDLAKQARNTVQGIDFDALKPTDGAWNLEGLSLAAASLEELSMAVKASIHVVEGVPNDGLIAEVAEGVGLVEGELAEVDHALEPLSKSFALIPNALGASGPRTYLLMFQGNSEARSLGGNAAVFLALRAENGSIRIIEQAVSTDFEQPVAQPVVALDPEAVNIYGDKIGRYTPDFTMIPNFPQAAQIAEAWWSAKFGWGFDGVFSADPVALAHILGATGPITLPTGDVLTAENAAPLLLNEIYFRYEDPRQQDAFFAAAAGSVFAALTSSGADPLGLLGALAVAADEGRVLYVSKDPAEAAAVEGLRLAGVMPSDNEATTAVGVYVNDNTGSKKSYYLDVNVDACRKDSLVSVRAQVSSILDEATADSLPRYISGPYFALPEISSHVVVYGPVGTVLQELLVDGQPAEVLSSGQHLGRPAVKVHIMNYLTNTRVIEAQFEGPTHGNLEIWTTPLSRATPVSTSECAG